MHDGLFGVFDRWLEHGFGVIAPSRPGYGRTPLEIAETSAESADCYAALLDVIKIDKVVTVGISAGGPSAIQFAARHP